MRMTVFFHLFVCYTSLSVVWGQNYLVGVGISDVTGPAANINMMGYANPGQLNRGIHLRLYSRAFVFSNRDGSYPVVFVSVDIGMISQLIRHEVLSNLSSIFGNLYTDDNVMLTATHTHSGPAAYHQYFLYQATSLGFLKDCLDPIVTGIVKSIQKAHNNRQPADLLLNSGVLKDASVNRSPAAYLNNPQWERRWYSSNVDTEMVVLKIRGSGGKEIGMVNWFPLHPVSMNNTNFLISSDNKGYASIRFEEDYNTFPGEGPFVAAFANSNLGDVSPNTRGPRCIEHGDPCNFLTNLCSDGTVQKCIAFGPGNDMFESTKLIGGRQFVRAKELYNSANKVVSGYTDHRLKYVDMTNQEIRINSTHSAKTCKAAMGYSFAAGTTDGPGALNFFQGDTEGSPLFNQIRNSIFRPSAELLQCQKPKAVLLPTGEMTAPVKWQPDIVDYQILKIGQLVIIGVPGEYTTMAGRRIKNMAYRVLTQNGFPMDTKVVLAGLANSYSSYVTTFEEYQIQRYEGGSTLYGPYTHQAAMKIVEDMAIALAKRRYVAKGSPPPNLKEKLFFLPDLLSSDVTDAVPPGVFFGQVLEQVWLTYRPGERVSVTFAAGSPNNDIQLGKTFLTVEKIRMDGTWEIVKKDSNWDTRFYWFGGLLGGTSNATITWDIPEDQTPGLFRIRHFGHSRVVTAVRPYIGTSSVFQVLR